MHSVTRSRLLAGAAFFFGASAIAPQQAMAQCVVAPGTVTCSSTTTTNTTNAGATPAVDRNYPADTSAAGFTGTINSGAVVDGFGLAFTNSVGGANALTVVNNGTLQVSPGNTATAGGSGAALFVSTIGATDLNYSGAGDVLNLGLGVGAEGDALSLLATGTGNITAAVGGSLTATQGGTFGLWVRQLGTAGNIAIGTIASETITAGSSGIVATIGNAASAGTLTIGNDAAIGSVPTALNTLGTGISADTAGTGAVTVINNGAIGAAADRVSTGISASIDNAASTATLGVSGSGAIFSSDTGIDVTNDGSGTTTVNYLGAIDTTGANGVFVNSLGGGAVDVTLGAVTATSGNAITIDQSDPLGAGAVTLNTTADVAASTDAIIIDNAGTGAVTVTVAGSVAAGAGDAIRVTSTNAAAGAIDITTTAGETIAASAGDGIEVDTAGTGDVSVTNAANITSGGGGVGTLQNGIDVESFGTGDVIINNSGAIGAAGDEAQLDGIAVDSFANGNITIAGSGDIFSVGDGIDAVGGGDISIVYGGDVTSDIGHAVFAVGSTGAVTITTGGTITSTTQTGLRGVTTTGALSITANGDVSAPASAGIAATSTTGSQTIAINADVSGDVGLISSTAGTRTITIGSAGSVNGTTTAIVIDGLGAASITNAGTIGTLTTDAAILVTGDADTTVTNQTGGVINGNVTFGGADDTLVNAGTINAGILDFGAGVDLLTNQAGGTLTVAGATPILGLETLDNAGTINAATGLTFDGGDTALTNTGTINAQGILDFGAGTDSFANSGAGIFNVNADTTLAGLEAFTNSGRINLNTFTLTGPALAFNNTGTIDTNGSATLAGFTSFSNAGTLDLAAGTFTVPAAVFVNSGTILADEGAATITGQTGFTNSGTLDLQDGAVGDVLTVNSAFVGAGGSNLLLDFDGATADRLVIIGAASGATTVNANFLGGSLINLDGVLVADTLSTTPGAFVLGAVGGDTPLVDFSLVQNGSDFFLVSAPTAAAFNPLAVPGFATDLWYQSANEVFAETRKPATTSGVSFWGNGYISRDKYGDDDGVVVDGVEFDVDRELETTRYGIQLGVDYGFAGGGRVGLTGGYGSAKADGNAGADLKADGWNLGVYGQYGGVTGFHAEFLAKHDRYDGEFDDGVFDGQSFDIRSTGIDGSIGYRFGVSEAAIVDVHAGLSHVTTKVDDISLFGFDYDISKLTSTRGRAGVRATFGGGLAPYIDATVYREFSGDGDIELFDGGDSFDLDTNGKATWVRFEAGLSGNNGPGPILAAWGDIGDRNALGLRAGWRFGGAVAPVVAPPLPVEVAPPPPPPATQTCPDGSVILATDLCPPAPEPVAPPPPEAIPERG